VNLQHLRLTLSLTGMLLAVAAVALNQRLLIWAAIGVLGMSVVVRIIMQRKAAEKTAPPRDDETPTS
jgi:membrane glycosyltransferase